MHTLRTAFVVLLLFFISSIVSAQDREISNKTTPEERAKFLTELMKTALNLDEKQTDAVNKINLKYSLKNQELLTSDERKLRKIREAKSLAKEKDKELQNVLTKDQFTRYQEKKDALKERIKERNE
jgi:flagellar basal body-associated protein FliL